MSITRSVYVLLCVSLISGSAILADEETSQAESPPVPISIKKSAVVAQPADAEDSANAVVEHSVFRPIVPPGPVSPFAQKDKEKPLSVRIYPMFNKLPTSGKCFIALEMQVKPGWHINANPSNPDFLVPTTVELKTRHKVKLKKTMYPKAHPLQVEGSPDPYHVYDGKTLVYGLLEIDESTASKFADLEFHVRFQGCNSTQCLPPDLVVMKGKLPLAAEGEELQKINADKFPKPGKKSEGAESAKADEATSAE